MHVDDKFKSDLKAAIEARRGQALARLASLVRALDDAGYTFRDIEFGFDAAGTLILFQVREPARMPLAVGTPETIG